MRILFLHGFGSRPGGLKPAFLRSHGHQVINPGLPDADFEESVRIAQRAFDRGQPDVVVGSSRGGAVAMNIHAAAVPLVLIAPAWRKWGQATTVKARTLILHSDKDDVVPVEHSRELARRSGLPDGQLVVVGESHKMIDEAAFRALAEAISSSRGLPGRA